ncbi:MAG: DUF4838 domain-containing protein [Promethearchaeota archaeon]
MKGKSREKRGEAVFVSGGSSEYVVVLPSEHSPSQAFAAEQLISFVSEATGAELEKVVRDIDLPAKCVILGFHPFTRDLDGAVSPDELGEEGYWWDFGGDKLVIAGSGERGTLYGVVSFLEEFLGVQWLGLEYTHVPKVRDVAIPALRRVVTPSFQYRMVTYLDLLDPDYSTFLKVNMNPFAEEHHGGTAGRLSPAHMTHTFYQLVPPKRYFEEHPEYFALVGGERVQNMGQLCLSNPDVVEIATKAVLRWFDEEPDVMSMGVVQNDCAGWCECEACREFEARHGGAHSAPIVHLCNSIAEKLAEARPGKFVHTIAYTYSLEPPENLPIRENVIVVPCDMFPDNCDNRPVGEHPRTERYLRFVERWVELADNVLVWHYCVDFVHFLLPFPNFRALLGSARAYHRLGVKGILFQGPTQLGVYGEFQEFRNWFCNKILWDIDLPLDELVPTFFEGFYGPAAGVVREYFDAVQSMADLPETNIHLYSGLKEMPALTREFVVEYQGKLEGALDLVRGDPHRTSHVEKVLLSLDYTYLLFPVEYSALLGKIFPKDLEYRKGVLSRFKSAVKKFNIGVVAESIPVAAFLSRQETICRENDILALAELAPTVSAMVEEVFSLVRASLDESGGFRPNDFIVAALKRGFHPLHLNNWMNEKEVADWVVGTDIWTRKFDEGRVEELLRPNTPRVAKKQLPKAVGSLIRGLPGQVEEFDD